MDEFLVSGETTWRNLERGLERAREFGGEMRVGYLPDMFGHIAQMPVARWSASSAVAGGIPSASTRRLLVGGARRLSCAANIYGSYSNERHPRMLKDSCCAIVQTELGNRSPTCVDERHRPQMPQPWLRRVVAEAATTRRLQIRRDVAARVPAAQPVGFTTVEASCARKRQPLWVSRRTVSRAPSMRPPSALSSGGEPLSALLLPPAVSTRCSTSPGAGDPQQRPTRRACSHDEVVDRAGSVPRSAPDRRRARPRHSAVARIGAPGSTVVPRLARGSVVVRGTIPGEGVPLRGPDGTRATQVIGEIREGLAMVTGRRCGGCSTDARHRVAGRQVTAYDIVESSSSIRIAGSRPGEAAAICKD
jgi:hypothetical protein